MGFGLVAVEGGLEDDEVVDAAAAAAAAGASGGGDDDEGVAETEGVDADEAALTGVDTFAASSSLMNFST